MKGRAMLEAGHQALAPGQYLNRHDDRAAASSDRDLPLLAQPASEPGAQSFAGHGLTGRGEDRLSDLVPGQCGPMLGDELVELAAELLVDQAVVDRCRLCWLHPRDFAIHSLKGARPVQVVPVPIWVGPLPTGLSLAHHGRHERTTRRARRGGGPGRHLRPPADACQIPRRSADHPASSRQRPDAASNTRVGPTGNVAWSREAIKLTWLARSLTGSRWPAQRRNAMAAATPWPRCPPPSSPACGTPRRASCKSATQPGQDPHRSGHPRMIGHTFR